MYPLVWDLETGGILLTDQARPDNVGGEIRPVFYEELDLLGLSAHWSYPRCSEPLLWAVGRRYYYRGELVAEAKGGGFYEPPHMSLYRDTLTVEPVRTEVMVERNRSLLEGLAFRAVEFLHDQHQRRRRRADVFAAAFSGGKDSLVVLDLAQRALAPDEFLVVFADTSMELAQTYDALEAAKCCFPNLEFHTARSHMQALESWRLFGPPSRIHRWCCSVHKTAPTILKLREVMDTPALDAVVFDGCRREESQRRFGYSAVSAGCKHPTQVNISPILEWTSAEIWLYLLSRELPYNRGYRSGFVRMGCAVCPFNSQWGEFVAWSTDPGGIEPFLGLLKGYAECELGGQEGAAEYVREGRWKVRSGGRALAEGGNRVIESDRGTGLSYKIRRRSNDLWTWLSVLGTLQVSGGGLGSVEAHSWTSGLEVIEHDSALELKVDGAQDLDRFARRDLRAVANKTAYCVRCRACEVECPTGALSVNSRVVVDKKRCLECGNCLSFVEKGCWAAKCLSVSAEGAGMKGVNAYQTFGMAEEWLDEFFLDPES